MTHWIDFMVGQNPQLKKHWFLWESVYEWEKI